MIVDLVTTVATDHWFLDLNKVDLNGLTMQLEQIFLKIISVVYSKRSCAFLVSTSVIHVKSCLAK